LLTQDHFALSKIIFLKTKSFCPRQNHLAHGKIILRPELLLWTEFTSIAAFLATQGKIFKGKFPAKVIDETIPLAYADELDTVKHD